MNIEAEKRDPHETGPPVKVFAQGGPDERTDAARLLMARQSPGLRTAREILADALAGRATAIMLDYTQEAIGVRHDDRRRVDSLGAAEPRDRRPGPGIAQAALRTESPRPPEPAGGDLPGRVRVDETIRPRFVSQGTPTGERIVIQFEEKKIQFKTLDELGMRAKLQEQLRALLDAAAGFRPVLGHPRGRIAEHDGRGAALLRPFHPRVRRLRGRRPTATRRWKTFP